MGTKILEVLKTSERALSVYEISDILDLKNSNELRELQETLNNMVNEFSICLSKKGKYLLLENSHYKKGRFSMHRSGNFGFVDVDNTPIDIRIDKRDFKDAMHNDTVLVEIDKKYPTSGKIVKVIARDDSNLVGEFYIKNGIGYVKTDNPRYPELVIDLKDSKGAVDGHKVLVKRLGELENHQIQAEVLKILGHKDDVGIDILSIVYEYGIPETFPDAVMTEIESIPSSVSEKDIGARKDLRKEIIFTIDGDDAKDFDDAVSARILENGNYFLGVHIADVSHYVKEDKPLGKEAYERGTSVYLVDRVIPMLPHKLSNGICSLNELVDRLTLTCDMEIDKSGRVVKYDVYPSVINSKKRMTYNNVNKILEKNEIVPGYEPFIENLKLMSEISSVLRKNKIARGYLDFDVDEMKIIVDAEGNPIDIKKRERGTGEKLIEDFMIAANESVATYLRWMGRPLIYRIHEEPDAKKIQQFINLMNGLGYRLKIKAKHFDARSMQNLLANLKENEEWPVLGNMALRTMKKAKYSTDNVGHYGLGSEDYTHFTSPIRRLPDLIIHRLIKVALMLDGYNKNYSYGDLTIYADHASLTEDRSVKCERAVEKYESAKYMMNHIDEEYDAIISSVSKEGLWVQLDNLIEGLIRISEIGNDYYDFNEDIQIIKGRKSGQVYRIGQKIRVIVTGASKETSEIDFAFAPKKKMIDKGDKNEKEKETFKS
jgi:ribonuclease R